MKSVSKGEIYDLIVIGGGPSGMMAAGRAAECGAKVMLIEKNKQLGKKLSITGGGRCNITNAEYDVRAFLAHFPESKEFLYSPFSKFSAKDTFDFFERRGLPLVIEARNRAFPKSQKATDVTRTMERYVKQNSVLVKTNIKVKRIKAQDDKVTSVVTSGGDEIFAHHIAIATGGMAAPETGSTGEGFSILGKLGHTISKPNPNVVPLTCTERWVHKLSGVTLSFMTIRFKQDGKTKIKKTGKILFTHFGVSGPLVLNSAHEVKKLLRTGKVEASIDMFPDTNEGELDRRVRNLFERHKNKRLKNVLPELIPASITEALLSFPELNLGETPIHSITKEERKTLVRKMKDLSFEITGTLGFKKAVIADGGVELSEVNFKNMTSTLYPNLYLLGDVLNINRPSGGFSLQLCWTTGWIAGSDVGAHAKR